ncbi:MAG TPA: hypothetical protein VFN10_17265, partial [Thermoanaerobaculia bacterium]|nr:hypothetical protein [Thermoanaerobaculia bacterium]
NLFAFANRGAINITITEHGAGGNASFTVADNVFIDVWRRSPRVAEGNQAHIYNNLLFRVGKGNTEDNFANGSNEWVGMETDNGAQAAIQANRYIPWKEKLAVNKQISIGPDTDVDLGAEFTDPNDPTKSTPDLTNEFDGANGTVPSPPTVLSLTGSSTST